MRARSRILVAGSVLASAIAIMAAPAVIPPSGICNLNATTANFSAQFAAAAGGQTICLAAGNYGTQTDLSRASQVTIQPQAGVAKSSITMALAGSITNGFIIDGITMSSIDFSAGTYKNFTVKNSKFTGLSIFRGCGSNQTNIMFDTNDYNDIAPSGYEGRIMFPSSGAGTCGVTIQNSQIGTTSATPGEAGCSDGFQGDPNGIRIIGNHFFNILQNYGAVDCASFPGAWHTDSLQFVGGGGLVQGNFFDDVEDCIMAPDSIQNATIIDNVCKTTITNNQQYGFTLGPDTGSRIEHNTLLGRAGGGGVRVFGGNIAGQSTGTILRNNCIVPALGTFNSTGGINTNNFNNCVFTGGSNPTTYAGFHLTAGSPGRLAATDGTDVGIP